MISIDYKTSRSPSPNPGHERKYTAEFPLNFYLEGSPEAPVKHARNDFTITHLPIPELKNTHNRTKAEGEFKNTSAAYG